MHRPVGLPANPKDPVTRPASREDRSRHRMRHLNARIPAEVADASSAPFHPCRQGGRSHSLRSACCLPKVPVLTPQTIEGAGLVEDREVCKSVLGSRPIRPLGIPDSRPRRADPIRHAVRRQRIVVPAQVPLGWSATHEAAIHVSAKPAVSRPAGGNPTLIGAKVTQKAEGITGWFRRKTKRTAGPRMHLGKVQREVRLGSSDTQAAHPQARRGQR